VRGREETLKRAVVKVAGCPGLSPGGQGGRLRLRFAAANWMYAFVIVAPAGMAWPAKRSPTVCVTLPSFTNSRSELVGLRSRLVGSSA
jgi:hypothetical protein